MKIKRFITCALYLFACVLFISCSVQKQLSRSAEKTIIKDSSLLNGHVGISIFDAGTSRYLYNYQGDKYFVPASNTKIPTCYAAMKYLGDSLVGMRYSSRNEAIVVQPTGDPTFLHPDFIQQPVYEHLKRYSTVIIENPLFTDFLGSGWSWNDYKEGYMAQRSNFPIYGNVVRFTWRNKDSIVLVPAVYRNETEILHPLPRGFRIEKPWEQNTFIVLPGSSKVQSVPFQPNVGTITFLLEDTLKKPVRPEVFTSASPKQIIFSQPTDSLLKPMMHRSDNFFAEQSLLMVSNELLGVMNDAKIIDTILKTDFKDLPQKPRWADGSGLSRYNLFTPQDFVVILTKMKNEFGMDRIKEIFPTGGEGTLSSYYKHDSTFIYAKTGTLSGVVALSGYLFTRKGKMLIFSVLVNNHNSSATAIRRAVEKYLQGIRNKY